MFSEHCSSSWPPSPSDVLCPLRAANAGLYHLVQLSGHEERLDNAGDGHAKGGPALAKLAAEDALGGRRVFSLATKLIGVIRIITREGTLQNRLMLLPNLIHDKYKIVFSRLVTIGASINWSNRLVRPPWERWRWHQEQTRAMPSLQPKAPWTQKSSTAIFFRGKFSLQCVTSPEHLHAGDGAFGHAGEHLEKS